MSIFRGVVLCALLIVCTATSAKTREYDVVYNVKLLPDKGYAEVSINIDDAALLFSLDFSLDADVHSHISANGKLVLRKGSARWQPPKKNARLVLRSKINHQRKNKKYDAIMNSDWAIFRGDDLIPSARVRAKKGARSVSRLYFDMPKGWKNVNTGWPRDERVKPLRGAKYPPAFIIDNPERKFDRPTGWMIAGKIATRRSWAGNTEISVSAPAGIAFQRMDILTYLHFVWPELEKAFGPGPEIVLIVGAGEPMWRGGLSASNSLFMHAERPLVSGNGTSTLLHEIVHMFTRVRGQKNDDWIAEGLAEFYSIELLNRAGGTNEERKNYTYQRLVAWSKGVNRLRNRRSSGPITAKATHLFSELNHEIKQASGDQKNLDDLTRELMKKRKVSFNDLSEQCENLIKRKCNTLLNVK